MTGEIGNPAASMLEWWRTAITEISPEAIRVRGYGIEQLIGNIGFVDMLWLLLRGDLPTPAHSRLLEAVLIGGAVHGPHAPSIAIARMAVTCGVGVNQAIGQGAAVLGDVHGGAVEQCMELFAALPPGASHDTVANAIDQAGAFVPGFGHRVHRNGDPRTPRLLALADAARSEGGVKGWHVDNARTVERVLAERKGRTVPMNLDGAAAAIFLELGFMPPVGRGLIVVARSIGILANVWEEMEQGGRLKGPVPRGAGYRYTGPASRPVPDDFGQEPD